MSYPTLRAGVANDPVAVKKWQSIVGVTQDGSFGPMTRQATIDWQRKKGLTADGVVGPVTWATATGAKIDTTVKTPQAGTDAQAYEIAKRAAPKLGMTEKEIQYVLAVARGEGFYGRGWGNPSKKTIEDSAKYGLTGYEGVGSNNWGATQGKGDAGSFMHVDYHADGSLYANPYRRWSTPELGFLDMAKIILNGGKRGKAGAAEIRAAINSGALRKAVFAQHANGYFELHPEKYLSAVLRNYGILTANLDWPKLLSEKGGTIIGTIVTTGILVAGAAAWFALKRS